MKRLFVLVALCGLSVAADTPQLSVTQKLKIRESQVKVQNIQLQMDQLEKQWNQLSQQKTDAQKELSDSVSSAFKELNIKPEEFDIDASLMLTAKPKPPDKVPPPEPVAKK